MRYRYGTETSNGEGTSVESLCREPRDVIHQHHLGEAAFKSILAAFDSKEISGKRLLPSAWVSEKTYRDLLVATGKYLESTPGQRQPKEFFFEMGRFGRQRGSQQVLQIADPHV